MNVVYKWFQANYHMRHPFISDEVWMIQLRN